MLPPVLAGHKALVVGVANDRSIAWGCARALRLAGADIAMTYLNEKARPHVEPLARELGAPVLLPLEVRDPAQADRLFEAVARECPRDAGGRLRRWDDQAGDRRREGRSELGMEQRRVGEARPVPEGAGRAGRERVLTVAELAHLWSQEMPEHVRVFLALLIGTAARPKAALQLTRFQCDLDRGTINLNPPGRVQTKKRRPVLPLPDWLRPWIEVADGQLVAYRGRPVQKIAGAFQTLRDSAGFGGGLVSPRAERASQFSFACAKIRG